MRSFSAQYLITNSGPALKRGVITTDDDGTILSITDTGSNLEEKHSIEFYNGIIIPGFVNCHCHLELSHMKGYIPRGTGLGVFIEQIRNRRIIDNEKIINSAYSANNDMYREGIELCADICNSSISFNIKKKNLIRYLNLLEVFGIDPGKANHRLDEILKISEIACDLNLSYSIVPHSVYSTSLPLLKLLRRISENNKVTSIHFMETEGEKTFLENHSGPVMDSFRNSGLIPPTIETVKNHADAVLNEITPSGNLILVHNTYTDRETIRLVKKRKNLYWCLCPNSNIYIENQIPPLNLFMEEGCEIVIGTDSLASNNKLSILEEIKTLQLNFPFVPIENLVLWSTYNGAKALGEQERYGKIERGKKPGLILLQDVDLINMKLLPESFASRLI